MNEEHQRLVLHRQEAPPIAFCVDPAGNGIGVAPMQEDRKGRPHLLLQISDAERGQCLTLRPDPEAAASFAYAILGAVNATFEAWTRWRLQRDAPDLPQIDE